MFLSCFLSNQVYSLFHKPSIITSVTRLYRDIDHDKVIEKPIKKWNFENGKIYKTFYTIIEDKNKNNYPEIFYICELKNIEDWIKTENEIEKQYTYTKRNIDDIKVMLKFYLSDLRWKIEVGGIEWGDYKIYTDRESQSKFLTNHILYINNIISGNSNWKTMEGFVDFTKEQMLELSIIVKNYVSDLYDIEKNISNDIDIINTFDEIMSLYNNIENVNWPSISLYVKNNL